MQESIIRKENRQWVFGKFSPVITTHSLNLLIKLSFDYRAKKS